MVINVVTKISRLTSFSQLTITENKELLFPESFSQSPTGQHWLTPDVMCPSFSWFLWPTEGVVWPCISPWIMLILSTSCRPRVERSHVQNSFQLSPIDTMLAKMTQRLPDTYFYTFYAVTINVYSIKWQKIFFLSPSLVQKQQWSWNVNLIGIYTYSVLIIAVFL